MFGTIENRKRAAIVAIAVSIVYFAILFYITTPFDLIDFVKIPIEAYNHIFFMSKIGPQSILMILIPLMAYVASHRKYIYNALSIIWLVVLILGTAYTTLVAMIMGSS